MAVSSGDSMIEGLAADPGSGKVSGDEVRQFLFDRGATVVGFAPASRFADAPAGHRATDIVSGARSVVVMGVKLVSACVNWPALAWEASDRARLGAWRVYDQCCFDAVNMRLEHMSMDLAIALELNGCQSFFAAGSDDMTVTELNASRLYADVDWPQPLDTERIAGLAADLESPSRYGGPFSFRHAAVAAGLATFGASNLALHPVFGPRVRWDVVITVAEMDRYDEPLTEPVCHYDRGCRECIETCPYGVFEDVTRFDYAGQSHPWAAMTGGRCYYSSTPCGGVCVQTCPAGTGDRSMIRAVARRYRRPGGPGT